MKNFSLTMSGIIAMVALPALVSFGISDSCSNELVAKGAPILAALPGAVAAWIGRMRATGPTTVGGFKKG